MTKLPSRRSARIPGFDYAQAGAYYVTICTKNRAPLLGVVKNYRFEPTDVGVVVENCWKEISVNCPIASIDYNAIMPDHLHGIIRIEEKGHKTLSQIIAAFKAGASSQTKHLLKGGGSLWQRGFFDHIVRDEKDLLRIRQYILNNPIQAEIDRQEHVRFYSQRELSGIDF